MSTAAPGAARPRCLLLSDFNVQPLANQLAAVDGHAMPDVDVGGFGQVAQALANPDDPAWRPQPDCTLAWTRPQAMAPAFAALLTGEACDNAALMRDVDAYAALLAAASHRTGLLLVPTWVAPDAGRGAGPLDWRDGHGIQLALARMNLRLAERLQDRPNVHLLDASRWMMAAGAQAWSPRLWFMAKVPWAPAVFAAAAADVHAALRALQGRTRKLLVLDLDDTLWGGVVGDVGWDRLVLGGHDHAGEAFAAFQDGLRALSRQGVVLALASKNTESVALEAIDRHPEMRLRRDDFAAWRIDWSDKAANIADIARELRLGLDAVVFIDDNPVERARVRQALPDVLVPEWPRDPMLYAQALRALDAFDALQRTGEDAGRASAYQAERSRASARSGLADMDAWLSHLDTRVVVEPLSASNLQRAAQLLNKTNQMNLRTRRMDAERLAAWAAMPGHRTWTFRVGDRFGDSGLTGIASLSLADGTAFVEDFVLSCRVMGRRVEDAMLAWLAGQSRALGASRLVADCLPTDRNAPCLAMLQASVLDGRDAPGFAFDVDQPCPVPDAITLLEPEHQEAMDT